MLKHAIELFEKGNYNLAYDMFYEMAKDGYPVAGYYLALYYRYGLGKISKNHGRAISLLDGVAQEGFPPAMALYGRYLEEGIEELSLPSNIDLAAQWYESAVNACTGDSFVDNDDIKHARNFLRK